MEKIRHLDETYFVKVNYIMNLVSKQAEDEGCWFDAKTAPEAYLQNELRRLHSAIESEFKHGRCKKKEGT